MRRVLIAGMTGSGKTTLGRRLAPALGLEYHELDDLYYGPGMRMAPEFPSVIDQITAGEQWLFDSQGPPVDSEAPLTVRDRLWARADTLVWLDYPRRVVVWRAVTRSLRRIITRERLWRDYRDSPLQWFRPDHPIRRAWRLAKIRSKQIEARTRAPASTHLTVVRLRSPSETETWLNGIRGPLPGSRAGHRSDGT
jgi:adenylate kinase family enzyme